MSALVLLAWLELGAHAMSDLPRISKGDEIAAQLGNRVTVIGTYRQLNLNQNKYEPPLYRGNVYLELEGGAVAIGKPGDPARARSADEIKTLEGKRVSASGTLIKSGGSASTAQIVMPYLAKLESLEPVK